MSHFSKHVTGSTRLDSKASNIPVATNAYFECSAYIKGDSLIVMAIDTTRIDYDLKLVLPYKVKSGTHLLSTSNESLCQSTPITIDEPVSEVMVQSPGRSLNTYIFMIYHEDEDAIEETKADNNPWADGAWSGTQWYDLQGRRTQTPNGLMIEKRSDGTTRKIFRKR